MGLTCSLLGHTFDETDVEREREERGNEVVTVVRDIERCSRCGAERIVAENKEVTSVIDADEVDLDEETFADDGGAEPSGGIGGLAARAGAYDDDDGETMDEGFTEEEYVPPENLEDEDAEILTDDDDEPAERAPGQWPDEPAEEPWEPEPVTQPADGDTGVEVVGGPAESAPEPDPEPEPAMDDIVEATPDRSTGAEPDHTVPNGSLVCDSCGHYLETTTSYRAGDACPACKAGWLEADAE